MAKQRPTRRQLEVPRAYIRAGSVAVAAHELGNQRDNGAPTPFGAVSADVRGHVKVPTDGHEEVPTPRTILTTG